MFHVNAWCKFLTFVWLIILLVGCNLTPDFTFCFGYFWWLLHEGLGFACGNRSTTSVVQYKKRIQWFILLFLLLSCDPRCFCVSLREWSWNISFVRFYVIPKDPMVTLLSARGNGNGSSSPVWDSGRGWVWVLYSLACTRQWRGKRCFTLVLTRYWV